MKKILVPFFILLLAAGAGCNRAAVTPDPSSTVHEYEHEQATTTLVSAAGERVRLKNTLPLTPGKSILNFSLHDDAGRPLTPDDLKIVHEKIMHLILVRDDLTQFQHLHPAYSNGQWQVAAQIDSSGQYQMYVDIVRTTEEALVLRVPLMVGRVMAGKNAPLASPDRTASDGEYKARLQTSNVPVGKSTNLSFSLRKQDGSGVPTTALKPYLGELGHVVALRYGDPDGYHHVHPGLKDEKDSFVIFTTIFPTAGRYTLFSQFNVGGNVRTFPITIDVE